MSMRRRLKRLEAASGTRGCGPNCPPEVVVRYRQHGCDGEPILVVGQEPPVPCARSGRPALVLKLVVVYDPDLYRNADRLQELKAKR
jgi:hypothetical protein